MRMPKQVIALLFCISLLSGAALAANTHLNISVKEIVNQNVTYAKNFWLVENQTYLVIEGALNVTNPGVETVFDIDIDFANVDLMTSDFIWVGGRNGTQVRYQRVASWATYREINTTPQALTNTSGFRNASVPSNVNQDIDEDGIDDYVSVNATHLLFNVSSEYAIIPIRLTDGAGAPVDIRNAGSGAVTVVLDWVNVTSLPNGDLTSITYAQIYVNGSTNTDLKLDPGMGFNVSDTANDYARIHITELRGGQSSRFIYNVSGSINPPLDVDTNYSQTNNRKVLAGKRFSVNDTVTNILGIAVNVSNINITIQALNITWDGREYNFTLLNLSNDANTDFANVQQVDNKTWYWNVGGGTLEPFQNKNLSYQVKAPYSVPSSGTYAAIRQLLSYRVDYAASNITVARAYVRARINFSVSKEIIGPQDNEQNRNVTWRAIPKIGARENITFTLNRVSIWVTTTLDPNEDTGISTSYDSQGPFNLSDAWTGGTATPWYFNFTDGSAAGYPPPIVWIKPYWIITNAYNQILNQSYTVNGTDIYLKYIYVINGYWLEVDKNISSMGDNTYKISTWVHNKGNGWTPINMTVTVYDFVPSNFVAYNFSSSWNAASNVSGQFTGTAYKWDIGYKSPMNSSLAPDDGAVGGEDEWNVSYWVNGSGDYVVSDLYIVGLDPIAVDGASASPLITVFTAVKSNTKEVIYAAIVVFLILLNTVNLLMTTRINKKLDKKGHDHTVSSIRDSISELKKK